MGESQGQQGRAGCGRGVDRGVREGSEGKPVQDLEPDVVGDLLPAAGARGGDREGARDGHEIFGVPTVADRIAQTVVAGVLEDRAERIFHRDSYGYRPGRSGLDAVGACRGRCWETDWVIDLDIQKFFDSVPWDLVVKAVQANTGLPWVVLYVREVAKDAAAAARRVLAGSVTGEPRRGSPVSPVLANLFLHYAFDAWMAGEFPAVRFERYVDDAVVPCVREAQARTVLAALQERMAQVGLTLHPDKTRIVYCKDGRRRGSGEHTSFTFLGYTFRARGVRTKTGKMMTGFNPAISKDALNRVSAQVRSWRLHRRMALSEADLARWINPIVRGWMNYYGAFYRSRCIPS